MDKADLLSETFIKPIRSVVLIDDQFPTYAQLAAGAAQDKGGNWDVDRAKRLVSWFSNSGRRCEVESAPDIDAPAFDRVRNADLVVLDFHLMPKSEDPTICLRVLRALNQSKHANLVVLLTAESDLGMVRRRCAIAISGPPPRLTDELADAWEDAGRPDCDEADLERQLASYLDRRASQRALPAPKHAGAVGIVAALVELGKDALPGIGDWTEPESPIVKISETPSGTRYLHSDNVFV
ncbi:MAG: hypothetical protein KC561_11420, partial [Myxococcales bacterium]|nr:hypothetical protein [Myxococcales bacterium]